MPIFNQFFYELLIEPFYQTYKHYDLFNWVFLLICMAIIFYLHNFKLNKNYDMGIHTFLLGSITMFFIIPVFWGIPSNYSLKHKIISYLNSDYHYDEKAMEEYKRNWENPQHKALNRIFGPAMDFFEKRRISSFFVPTLLTIFWIYVDIIRFKTKHHKLMIREIIYILFCVIMVTISIIDQIDLIKGNRNPIYRHTNIQ